MSHKHELKTRFLKEGYVSGVLNYDGEIAKKLNISKDTAKYVQDKLKKECYFSNTRLEINLPKIGLDKFAWLFVSLNWDTIDEDTFYKKALSLAYVHTIAEITGEYDFAVKIFGPSIQSLNSFVLGFEKIFSESLIEIQPMYSIHEYKRHYKVLNDTKKAKLSKIDCLILEEKNKNPSISLFEISKKIGVHRNTVSKRWNYFWKNQIILKESLELTELGFNTIKKNLKAFVIIKPTPGYEEKIISELVRVEDSQDVFHTMSNLIVATVRLDGSSALADFHKEIFRANKHIKKTNTIVFLRKKSRSYMTKQDMKNVLGKNCAE